MAARSSVRKTSGVRSLPGHSSEMNTAMPRAIGVEIASARMDEYSVPQMNGRAPNWPATGSQVCVVQKLRPNFWMESMDSRVSSTAMPATMRTRKPAKMPVPNRKPRSPLNEDLGFMNRAPARRA